MNEDELRMVMADIEDALDTLGRGLTSGDEPLSLGSSKVLAGRWTRRVLPRMRKIEDLMLMSVLDFEDLDGR